MPVSLTSLVANSVVVETMTNEQIDQAYRLGKAFRDECIEAASAAGNAAHADRMRSLGVLPVLREQGVLSLCLSCGTTVVTATSVDSEAARKREQRGYARDHAYALECCGTVFLP